MPKVSYCGYKTNNIVTLDGKLKSALNMVGGCRYN